MSKPNKRRQAKQKARAESLRKRTPPATARRVPEDDPFLTERLFRRIALLQEAAPAESPVELEEILQRVLSETPEIESIAIDQVKADPLEMAQEIAFQALAWTHAEEVDKGIRLARRALDLDPDNPDANALLADPGPYMRSEDAALESLLEVRAITRQRLEARHGTPLPGAAQEAMLRPYHRLLALLLHQAPLHGRHELAQELALEIAKLGMNIAMDAASTMGWLLAGRNRAEAEAIMDRLEQGPEDAPLATDSVAHLRWWRSWSAFQAGDTVRAQRLAELAAQDYPDSGLFLFAYTEDERSGVDDSPHFDEFTENFLPLLDPIHRDEDYCTAARGWLGLDC